MAAMTKRWCFTLNNPTADSHVALQCLPYEFLCFGKELAPSTGTPHLQGYIIMKSNQRMSAMIKKIPGAHLEAAKGTTEQNVAYCMKEGTYSEYGVRPKTPQEKGAMNAERFKDAFEAAKEGRLDDIPHDIRLRYYGTLKTIMKDYMPVCKDADDTTGWWFYGASGTGKSRQARVEFPGSYMKMCNKWWDGYQDHDTVIIDDLDTNHSVLGHHLKIWADRYAFLAETKGGALMIRPKKIVVTSQYPIEEIWTDEATREALNRRFKKKYFPKPLSKWDY